MTTPPDPEQLVAQHFPIDGPHNPELLANALQTTTELVRYANHATGSWSISQSLPTAPDVYTAVGALATLTSRLGELVGKFASHTAALAADPHLRHDQHRRDPQQAHTTADRAALTLALASSLLREAGDQISVAQGHLSHLYEEQE